MQTYVSKALWPQYALAGGDDYELLFTVAAEHKAQLEEVMAEHDLSYSHIGEIVSAGQSEQIDVEKLDVEKVEQQINYFNDKQLTTLVLQGWDHFQ